MDISYDTSLSPNLLPAPDKGDYLSGNTDYIKYLG